MWYQREGMVLGFLLICSESQSKLPVGLIIYMLTGRKYFMHIMHVRCSANMFPFLSDNLISNFKSN